MTKGAQQRPPFEPATDSKFGPVYLCGPIADVGAPARGGYQACNRRTIDALGEIGIDVQPLPYPHPNRNGAQKWIAYLTGFLHLLHRLNTLPRDAILHITGLYKHFVYVEWIVVKIAKFKGCRVIYDIRAGAMIRYFTTRTGIYRATFASVLRTVDLVAIEGEPYRPLVERITGRPALYLPNHVDSDLSSDLKRIEPIKSYVRIAYVGRIAPEKGIETALEATQALRRIDILATVTVMGSGESAYISELRKRYSECNVDWTGALDQSAVLAHLSKAHFFVFPTAHLGEGHSNALTEAMLAGCVPIVSDCGFNRQVVGESGLVLPLGATSDDYAQVVRRVVESGTWSELSSGSTARCRELFSSTRVAQLLADTYRALQAAP